MHTLQQERCWRPWFGKLDSPVDQYTCLQEHQALQQAAAGQEGLAAELAQAKAAVSDLSARVESAGMPASLTSHAAGRLLAVSVHAARLQSPWQRAPGSLCAPQHSC